METRDIEITSDELGIIDRVFGIFRMLRNPLENPLFFLFLVFLSYLLVDVVATLVLVGEIEEWYIPLIHFLIGYVMIAIFFSRVLPDFFQRKRKVYAVVSLVVLIGVLTAVKLEVISRILNESLLSKAYLVQEFLRVFHFLAITSAFWILYDNLGLRKRKFEIEMSHERLKVEHRSMQLSPHFLMNVLTLFAARMLKLSPTLFREFSHLSALLRYAIKEFGHPNSLKEEIDAVNHFLEVQRFRFRDVSMALTIAVDRDVADVLPMPKMCLLTLVENVFFHGNYMDRENPCRMEFVLSGDGSGRWTFRVSISNRVQKSAIKVRSGFGASAVFRVLGDEFGEGFQYSVDSDELMYLLQMTIDYGTGIQGRTD
jgi:hypothetical protein